MPYSLNKWPEPPEAVSDAQRAGIEEVIKKFDEEAKLWDRNARWALNWIFVCFGVCLTIFLLANVFSTWHSNIVSGINEPQLQQEITDLVKTKNLLLDEQLKNKHTRDSISQDYPNVPNRLSANQLEFLDSITNTTAVSTLRTTYASLYHQYHPHGDPSELRKEQIEFLNPLLESFGKDTLTVDMVRQMDSVRELIFRQLHIKDSILAMKFYIQAGLALDTLQKAIDGNTGEQNRLSAKIIQKNNKIDFYDFVNESSTRIGAILILVFMVQYLSRIHRYNKKLADYYAARANALRLHLTGLKDMNYHKIVHTISPDAVDLRFVKAPTDKVLDLVKTALESGGKMVSK